MFDTNPDTRGLLAREHQAELKRAWALDNPGRPDVVASRHRRWRLGLGRLSPASPAAALADRAESTTQTAGG